MIPLALLLNAAPAGATDVVRSPADARAYQALTLDNGLRVLLVSDPATDLAAAALNVGVGYFSDPPGRPGLAHFLEHMLFLGTEKYPEPDAYRDFITRHGGRINASTGAENTVYFFDIGRDHLEPALDRFAQFFIAPLFSEDYVQREMQAVEAEYRLRLRDDGRRLSDAVKETINPAHPLAKFSTGNLDTLRDREGEAARDAVIAFYERHYSANLMTLAVIGAEPLERLRAMVERHLGPVRNTGRQPLEVRVPVLAPGQGPQRLDVVPFRDQRLLRIEFAFPWREEYALSKPAAYLAHLLGHEGEGSLHALLQGRGWITRIGAGGSRIAGNEGVFTISLDLTEAGVAAIDEIAAQTFQYLALIAREGVRADIHEELVRINRLNFFYREKAPPRSEAVQLAANLHVYPAALAVSGPYHFEPYDERTIRDVLAWLRPDNLRLTVVAPGLPATQRSRYYGTPYRMQRLEAPALRRWAEAERHPALALPAPNAFLPRQARLKPIESAAGAPVLISEGEGLRIWHLQDTYFRVPKADLFVSFESPAAVESPRGAALTALFLSLAREALTPYAYPAEAAGLRYEVYRTARGFGFSISGYDENKRLLSDLIVDRLLDLEIDPGAFAVQRAELVRQWENSRLNSPYTQLFGELDHLLHLYRWTPEELLHAIAGVSRKDLEDFVPALLAELRLEVFAHGNLTAAETRSIGEGIADRFFGGARPGRAVAREVARLAPGSQYLRSIDTRHDDTALLVYYQAGDAEVDTAARVLMIEQLVKAAFFDTLRTREQLGYVVSAQSMSALRVPGLNFLVQSPAQGPQALAARIDRFIESFRDRIAAMGPDEFARHRQGLLAALREKDASLARRSQRLQADLAAGDYTFDRKERLARAVEGLDRDQVLAFYEDYLLSARRSRIVLQATGQAHLGQAIGGGEGLLAITDVAAFRGVRPSLQPPAADDVPGTPAEIAAAAEDTPGGGAPDRLQSDGNGGFHGG